MNARTIGYISKEEWMTGMQALNTDSKQKLQKRLPDLGVMVKDHTDELYRFAFNYAKNPDQRCMDVEIACFLWRIILAEKYPIVNDFTEFLEQKQPVKVINRDQWLSFYDFVNTVSPDLSDYDEMSAWPTLFDEFVEWKKQ
ncbi:DCN1, defective in cullin neddylation 1, domain-containing 4 [Syncephalastrum racemosum]|uniref:Defective in cullin neddylation protein n=1 Tax=Syncephalastrum racemosum TaxID=13706 RepID=A0A1X2H080_SYNRA|nr:DCN1, defective in cullin neddylation 1, domain-containing 4 [Syncephalastrum racemosum]